MSNLISKQVLELWNRYKPTIAVDAIEYDRELKKLLSTNLASLGTSLGTDCISREQAIEAIEDFPHGNTWNVESMEEMVYKIRQLPPIQPKRIRGQWSIKGQAIDTVRGYWAKCSACGHSVFGGGNYCSYCGSYNKGEVME